MQFEKGGNKKFAKFCLTELVSGPEFLRVTYITSGILI
jgi:hypothetical protein